MTQQLIRIGKGVPGADRSKRKLRPETYWILAAAVLIAVGGMVWAVIVFGPPSSQPQAVASGLPVQTQIECENIRHAHEVWDGGRDELNQIPAWPADVAGYEAHKLADSGKTYLDAVSNQPDEPAKALTVAVAQYNLDAGMVALGLNAGGHLDKAAYDKAVASWVAAEQAYGRFLHLTCGL